MVSDARENYRIVIDGEIAYWMRWGMDNIGNDDPSLVNPLRIFKANMVTDDDRRNGLLTMLKSMNSKSNGKLGSRLHE